MGRLAEPPGKLKGVLVHFVLWPWGPLFCPGFRQTLEVPAKPPVNLYQRRSHPAGYGV